MPHESTKELAGMPPGIISAAASLFGIGLLVAWSEKLTKRQLVLIILSGICAAIIVPPFLVPMAMHKWGEAWWPGIEYLYSVAGFLSGLLGVKVVAAILVFSDKLPAVAGKAADRIGGGEK